MLAGKYRIERKIGEGGMGMVVVARHLELDEQVAIKFLVPEALSSPDAVMRFAREARASVKIRSEHVARTLDVGKLENGAPYMVMEYLQGVDLGARLRKSGPLPIEQAVDFILQTCHALADAHVIGIIHRDIKPSNLFIIRKSDGTESVKVLDFGISKITGAAAGSTDMGMTRTQALMGSPIYMSPEQMASTRDVGVSTDIWALGITLHELLTGHAPFEGETITELCSKVLTQPSPRLGAVRKEAPDGLQAVIDVCLEKSPAKRYLNVADLATALAAFGTKHGRLSADSARRVLQAAGMSLSSPTQPPAPVDAPAQPSAGTVASWSQTHPETKRHTGPWIGLAVSVVVIGAVVAAVTMTRAPKSQSTATTSAAASSPSSVPLAATSTAPSSPEPVAKAAPVASASSSIELITEPPNHRAPDKSNSAIQSRNDIKERPGGMPPVVARTVSAPPKASRGSKNKPPASSLTDFGGRTR